MVKRKIAVAIVFAVFAVFLGEKEPLKLKNTARKWYVASVVGVNLWCAIALTDQNAFMLCSQFILVNLLLMMSVTDLKEKMVYDIHFYVVLLVGIAGTMLDFRVLVVRVGMFAFLMAVFFLTTRKKQSIGAGDTRMVAAMALYFSFTQWVEVMLMALGSAAVYGVIELLRKKKTMDSQLPFMPFLLVGVLAGIIL